MSLETVIIIGIVAAFALFGVALAYANAVAGAQADTPDTHPHAAPAE